MRIFLLSKQHTKLSVAEVLALQKIQQYRLLDNLLVANASLTDRLAYTKRIYRLLFECGIEDLSKHLKTFNWNRIYQKNFAVRAYKVGISEKELAGHIWNSVKNPKVNLENPKTAIHLFKINKKILCGLLEWQNEENFNSRRAHLKPGFSPVSLHPQVARAMVNLTGAKKGDTILDPFCGIGGILVEAGLMGLKPIGIDIDEDMLIKAQQNLDLFKINAKLKQGDSTKLKRKYKYVVTDLPYGKNTKDTNIRKLFKAFISNKKFSKAVVGLPNFIKTNNVEKFDYYIHKSMTKKIVVLR